MRRKSCYSLDANLVCITLRYTLTDNILTIFSVLRSTDQSTSFEFRTCPDSSLQNALNKSANCSWQSEFEGVKKSEERIMGDGIGHCGTTRREWLNEYEYQNHRIKYIGLETI